MKETIRALESAVIVVIVLRSVANNPTQKRPPKIGAQRYVLYGYRKSKCLLCRDPLCLPSRLLAFGQGEDLVFETTTELLVR